MEDVLLRHRLTDAQWELISDLFQVAIPKTGPRPRDRRLILDGIFWVLQTGAPWRDLPSEFGPWSTAWAFFDRWNKDGTLDAVLDRLREPQLKHNEQTRELWCIDGTSIRAARAAAGGAKKNEVEQPADHALGRSRGGWGSKLHLLCDGDGNPLDFHVTPGQAHDITAFETLMTGANARFIDEHGNPLAWPAMLAGDKGYRAAWVDAYLLERGIQPVIPSKENENREQRPIDFDKPAYRRRNIVERVIGWLKESRRIVTRFEKSATNFCGMVKMAFIRRYLRLHGT